jgi:hypothetical protein
MGVAVDTVTEPFEAAAARAITFEFAGQRLSASDTDSWRAVNEAWNAGRPLWRDPSSGDFRVQEGEGLRRLRRPRIGLYKSYLPAMDEGWTRWILERFGFRYESVVNSDLHHGNLNDRFDVIVFADQRGEAIHSGHKAGSMPPEYTGGAGEKGVESLKAFAAKGGTLVFLNDASEYALSHLGITVRNVLSGIPNTEFYAPGSLVNVHAEPHWLTLGMPAEFAAWFESSPAFDVSGGPARTVVSYGNGNLLASGWLLGEKHLVRKAAVVDVPAGSGHVTLFGMRPQYRAQSYLTLKMFFNSLTYFEH